MPRSASVVQRTLRMSPCFVAVLILLAVASSAAAQAGKKRPPNIVFFLVDDMGWTDASCFGSRFYETPNIDRLVKSGMQFRAGYAACPVCSPTRASILTGKYPTRLQITNFFTGRRRGSLLPAEFRNYLPLEEFTLAESLRAAGYATGFFGKWHLGGRGYDPELQGFDINVGGGVRGSPRSYFSPYFNPKLKDGPKGEHLCDRLTTEAISFIRKNRDRPFLAYLSFYSVHTPLQAKKELIRKYRAKAEKLKDPGPIFGKEHKNKYRLVQNHPVYAGMIETLDHNIGRVLDLLAELGLTDNTIIVFTSDNGGLATSEGWPTTNRPLRGGKGWLYEGGIRVPFVIAWQGRIRAGTTCDVPVISNDFYPTLLELAGLPLRPMQHLDGATLAPLLLEKGTIPDRPLFWHYPHYSNQGGGPAGAVRDGDYVLIEDYEDGHLELYNLKKDLGQKHNLAPKMPQLARRMHFLLVQWRRAMNARMPRQPNDG